MGAGLEIDTNGHNIAFLGGTGILTILDVVARLALFLCEAIGGANAANVGERFKFTLFYAARSYDEALGYDLLMLLKQYNE